jgi:hypothetical protein
LDPWRRPVVVLYGEITLMVLTVVSFVWWYRNHREYQEYLRRHHPVEHERLTRQDRVIDAFGNWIRWPIGSAWLLFSIFNMRDTYGDNNVRRFKQRAAVYFLLFVGLFAAAFVIALLAR